MLVKNFKKYLLVTFFIFKIGSTAFAQGNLPYIDDRTLHFGFSLGMNAMDFGIAPSNLDINGKIYQADVSKLNPGFTVGIISDLRLSRYFSLRFTPTLHFGDRQVNYTYAGSTTTDSIFVSSIPVCVPLHLKYSAQRKGNYRPYLLWGGGAYFDLGRNKENPILLKPLGFYTEFGVGCDLYFSFFKLAPELKFAIGLNDILTPLDQRDAGFLNDNDKKYTLALSKLTAKMITLSFNFE